MATFNNRILNLCVNEYNKTELKGDELEAELLDFQDTKCYIETDINAVCPDEIQGDGVKLIKDVWATRELSDGRTFVHIANNLQHTNGNFSHNYRKATKEEVQTWVDLFETTVLYSIFELQEIERVLNMTIDDYKILVKEKMKIQRRDTLLNQFYSDAKYGEMKQYKIDEIGMIQLMSQYTAVESGKKAKALWHPEGQSEHDTWSYEELNDLNEAYDLFVNQVECSFDCINTRIDNAVTKEEVDLAIADTTLTEEEELRVNTKIAEIYNLKLEELMVIQ